MGAYYGNLHIPAIITIALLLLAALTAGCGNRKPEEGQEGTGAKSFGVSGFETAVAGDVQHDFRIYWLGTSFVANGERYVGPVTAFPGIDEPDRFDFQYVPQMPPPGVGLSMYLLTPSRWESMRGRVIGRNTEGSRDIQIGETTAQLYRTVINGVVSRLVVKMQPDPQTVVVAFTFAEVSFPQPTPNPNPLMTDEILLGVLGQLRPYPQ